jgi:CPA2 family monovalent cation:H+ antiporter-2
MSLGEDLIVLGLLFLIAYVLGRLGNLVGLPAIPVYMVVGLLASPNTHVFPLNFDPADVELIAVFGLVLLLFSLGLEFDQDAFFTGAGRLLLSGGSYILINTGAGLLFGFLIGWGPREALIIAGMIGTSSSAIITKLLIELKRLANEETPVLLGVTVVGDIFIAVYLAIVSVVLSGETEPWPIVLQLTIAFLFLVVMFVVARWGGRVVTRLTRTRDEELFTILFFGLVVLFAGIGELIGVTDAIGAFLIGLVLGSTRHRARIERMTVPLRDVFAAFFFLNFGLALDVAEFGHEFGVVVAAVVLTFAVNLLSAWVIARLHGLNAAQAINTAAIMVNRGEFTLILATLALGADLDPRLQPFAGLYVLLMAVLGPLFASNSERIGQALVRRRRHTVAPARPPRDLERENAIALMEAATADMTEDTRDAGEDGEGDRRNIQGEPRSRHEREREPDY